MGHLVIFATHCILLLPGYSITIPFYLINTFAHLVVVLISGWVHLYTQIRRCVFLPDRLSGSHLASPFQANKVSSAGISDTNYA